MLWYTFISLAVLPVGARVMVLAFESSLMIMIVSRLLSGLIKADVYKEVTGGSSPNRRSPASIYFEKCLIK